MGDKISEFTSSSGILSKGVKPWSGKLRDPTAQEYLLWRASMLADAKDLGIASALLYASEADYAKAVQTTTGGDKLLSDSELDEIVRKSKELTLLIKEEEAAADMGKPGLVPVTMYEELLAQEEAKFNAHQAAARHKATTTTAVNARGEIPVLCFDTQKIRAVNRLINYYTSDLAKMLVHAESDPYVMLQKMDIRYGARGNVGKDKIGAEWTAVGLKQQDGEEPMSYMERVEDVARRWNSHELVKASPELKKEDSHIRDKIIEGLHKDYITYQTLWDRERDKGVFTATLFDIVAELQSYYDRMLVGTVSDSDSDTPGITKGKGLKSKTTDKEDRFAHVVCYNCNRKGHFAKDCTSKCLICNKHGHSRRDCPKSPSKRSTRDHKKKHKKKNRATSDEESDSDSESDEEARVKTAKAKKKKAQAKLAKKLRATSSDESESDSVDEEFRASSRKVKKAKGKTKMARFIQHPEPVKGSAETVSGDNKAPNDNETFYKRCELYENLPEEDGDFEAFDEEGDLMKMRAYVKQQTSDIRTANTSGGTDDVTAETLKPTLWITHYHIGILVVLLMSYCMMEPADTVTLLHFMSCMSGCWIGCIWHMSADWVSVFCHYCGMGSKYFQAQVIELCNKGGRGLKARACKGKSTRVQLFFDTGATHTCLRRKELLQHQRSAHLTLEGMHTNQVYNTMGTAHMLLEGDKGKEVRVQLPDAVWTPEATEDIIAWVQLKQAGFQLHDTNEEAWITSSDGQKVPLLVVDGLLYIEARFPQEEGKAKANTAKKEMTQLHFHEAYAHVRDVKELLREAKRQGIHLTDCQQKVECRSCNLQDIQRKHVAKVSKERSREPGGRVFLDLVGKIKLKARDGRTTTVAVAVDDCTSRGFLNGLAGKAGKYTSQYLETLTEDFSLMGVKIKKVRTDAGKEWLNSKVRTVAADNGIKREVTSPHTPEQNCRVEKRIVLIFRLALKLLCTGGFYGTWRVFWVFACLHACYLINYRPTSANANNVSPMEMWAATTQTKFVPMVDVPFGSIVYIIKHDKKKEDMDDRGEEAMFLGVAEELGRGSILFKLKTKKIIITEHYTFHHENVRYAPKEYPTLHEGNIDGNDLAELFADALLEEYGEGTVDEYRTGDESGVTLPVATAREEGDQTVVFRDTMELVPTEPDESKDTESSTATLENEETNDESEGTNDDSWCGISDSNILTGKRNRVATMLEIDNTEYGLIKQAIRMITSKASYYIPKTYQDVVNMKDKVERRLWIDAICEELGTLKARGVWKKSKRPINKKVIKSMLVFDLKINGIDGSIERRKARWVAKDFAGGQTSLMEVFAPVIGSSTAKLIIAKSIQKGFRLRQWDVKNAYVLAPEPNEMFVEQPVVEMYQEGDPIKYVFKLIKSLYGTRTAGRNWNKMINEWLVNFGFTRSLVDPCLYTMKGENGEMMLLGLYVDDIILATNWNDKEKQFEKQFTGDFEVKEVTNGNFLGCHMIRNEGDKNGRGRQVTLCQENYWNSVLERFNMTDVRPRSTPITPGLMKRVFTEEELEKLDKSVPFRELIGSLLYGVIWTRPDLANAVRWLGSKASDPRNIHWTIGKNILRYIQGTKGEKLKFTPGDDKLSLYTDASYASEVSGKSVLGYAIFYNGGCITAKSKAEGISLSTMDAEFSALSNGIKEVLALKDLLASFSPQGPIDCYCDNKSTITVIKSEGATKKSRLIRLKYMHAKHSVLSGEVQVHYVATGEQVADILTKDLGRLLVKKFRDCLLGKSVSG